jgi:hypothetical protein
MPSMRQRDRPKADRDTSTKRLLGRLCRRQSCMTLSFRGDRGVRFVAIRLRSRREGVERREPGYADPTVYAHMLAIRSLRSRGRAPEPTSPFLGFHVGFSNLSGTWRGG